MNTTDEICNFDSTGYFFLTSSSYKPRLFGWFCPWPESLQDPQKLDNVTTAKDKSLEDDSQVQYCSSR